MIGVVRQYRKLDDQVVTRLNRAQAQLRDEVRQGKGDSPDGVCAKMWAEMMSECTEGRKARGKVEERSELVNSGRRGLARIPTDLL